MNQINDASVFSPVSTPKYQEWAYDARAINPTVFKPKLQNNKVIAGNETVIIRQSNTQNQQRKQVQKSSTERPSMGFAQNGQKEILFKNGGTNSSFGQHRNLNITPISEERCKMNTEFGSTLKKQQSPFCESPDQQSQPRKSLGVKQTVLTARISNDGIVKKKEFNPSISPKTRNIACDVIRSLDESKLQQELKNMEELGEGLPYNQFDQIQKTEISVEQAHQIVIDHKQWQQSPRLEKKKQFKGRKAYTTRVSEQKVKTSWVVDHNQKFMNAFVGKNSPKNQQIQLQRIVATGSNQHLYRQFIERMNLGQVAPAIDRKLQHTTNNNSCGFKIKKKKVNSKPQTPTLSEINMATVEELNALELKILDIKTQGRMRFVKEQEKIKKMKQLPNLQSKNNFLDQDIRQVQTTKNKESIEKGEFKLNYKQILMPLGQESDPKTDVIFEKTFQTSARRKIINESQQPSIRQQNISRSKMIRSHGQKFRSLGSNNVSPQLYRPKTNQISRTQNHNTINTESQMCNYDEIKEFIDSRPEKSYEGIIEKLKKQTEDKLYKTKINYNQQNPYVNQTPTTEKRLLIPSQANKGFTAATSVQNYFNDLTNHGTKEANHWLDQQNKIQNSKRLSQIKNYTQGIVQLHQTKQNENDQMQKQQDAILQRIQKVSPYRNASSGQSYQNGRRTVQEKKRKRINLMNISSKSSIVNSLVVPQNQVLSGNAIISEAKNMDAQLRNKVKWTDQRNMKHHSMNRY